MASHVVVCGLDPFGLRVVQALCRVGEQVVVVDDSSTPRLSREAERAGARLAPGSGAEIAELDHVDLATARCLVLTANADLENLHTALAAREANPGLRVVIRMFSTDLARRTMSLLPNSRVLSTSHEAAPLFATAALGTFTVPTRQAWGRHLAVAPLGGRFTPNGGQVSQLQVLARAAIADTRARLRWSRRASVPAGESPEPEPPVDLGEGQFLVPLESPPLPKRRRRRRLKGMRLVLRALFDRRLAVTVGLIALLLGLSIPLFHTLRLSWIDASYLAVQVMYGNGDLRDVTPWLKLYAIGFMLTSALAFGLFFALVADAVVGTRILEALGVPRGRMQNHVVVVGLGNTGYRVVQHLLESGTEVAAVDSSANLFVQMVRRQGVPVLVTDATYSDSLRLLSIDRARAVVAVTNRDLVNLEATLAARDLNPNVRVVARVFEPALAERAQRQLGIDACHSVSTLATPAFVAAALGDGVLTVVDRGDALWLIAEQVVRPGSPADDALTQSLEAGGDLRVIAVRDRDGVHWRPSCPARLGAGNEVLVASSRASWEHLKEQVRGSDAPAPRRAGAPSIC
jgi:Trk K+ transport system NAD-binding subunit